MRESHTSQIWNNDTPEFWVKAGQYGDCEDYALAKRNALLNAGWPKQTRFVCLWKRLAVAICCLWVETDKKFYPRQQLRFPVKTK